MALADGTTIGRLRIRAIAADADALRMRSASALRSLDLQPPSMPAQSILSIRTLPDPLPGGIDLRFSHATRPEVWERAARAQIAQMLRRAMRPALGPVPASAEAVLFADHSELLACAARAAADGLLQSQWWWEHLLIAPTPAAVLREWQSRAAYVPAAFELLARENQIHAFACIAPTAAAIGLLASVLHAHALPTVAAQVIASFERENAPVPIAAAAPMPAVKRSTAPWREIAPEAEQSLPAIEHRIVAAFSLVLRRRPAVVRSETFIREVVDFIVRARDDVVLLETRSAAPEESPPVSEVRTETAHRQDESPPPIEPAERVSIASPLLKQVVETRPSKKEPEERFHHEASGISSQPPIESHIVAEKAQTEAIDSPPRDEPSQVLISEPPRRRFDAVPPLVPDLVIQSEFGGLFFLLNVFIGMELYSDFTSPVQYGLDIDLWKFLRLVARSLTDESLEEDAVWPFLEALAGDDDPVDGERIAGLVETIRERLSMFEDPAFLIRRFARITTSPAHLDVHFSLAAHPIEIRLGGLDRDPGWMPAAGRHVAFHFD